MNNWGIDWQALRAPFDPAEVDFRPQKTFDRNGQMVAVVVAYIDARVVQDRLDAVVGPEHWSFEWTPLKVRDDGVVLSAKGTITIHDLSKSDIGDASDQEPSKGCVSDAFKRAAVMWGIGRYLYSLGTMYAPVEMKGKSAILPEAELAKLRAKLKGNHTHENAPVTRQEGQQPTQSTQTTSNTTDMSKQSGTLASVQAWLNTQGYKTIDEKAAVVMAAGLPWKSVKGAIYTAAELHKLVQFVKHEQERKSA